MKQEFIIISDEGCVWSNDEKWELTENKKIFNSSIEVFDEIKKFGMEGANVMQILREDMFESKKMKKWFNDFFEYLQKFQNV